MQHQFQVTRTRSQTPVWERTCAQELPALRVRGKKFVSEKSACFVSCAYAKPELCAQARSQAGAWERVISIYWFSVIPEKEQESTAFSVIPAKAGIHRVLCHSCESRNPLFHQGRFGFLLSQKKLHHVIISRSALERACFPIADFFLDI
jgi:hypothetical protein